MFVVPGSPKSSGAKLGGLNLTHHVYDLLKEGQLEYCISILGEQNVDFGIFILIGKIKEAELERAGKIQGLELKIQGVENEIEKLRGKVNEDDLDCDAEEGVDEDDRDLDAEEGVVSVSGLSLTLSSYRSMIENANAKFQEIRDGLISRILEALVTDPMSVLLSSLKSVNLKGALNKRYPVAKRLVDSSPCRPRRLPRHAFFPKK